MPRRTPKQLAQHAYDILLAGGAATDETFIPAEQQKRHWGVVPIERMVELVGVRVTVQLVRQYGGRYLPTHRVVLTYLRYECIIRDWERGLTTLATLKAKYKCSATLVSRAIAEAKRRARKRTAERLAEAEPDTFIHNIRVK